MPGDTKILEGHSELEKGAYLGALASIASADRSASPEEIEYLSELSDAADLSGRQKDAVIRAASEVSGEELTRCLDILKDSDLKYPLITELMAFAKSDSNYGEQEQENIEKIRQYLGVTEKQFSLLDEFSDKANIVETPPEEMAKPGFLSALGLNDKMKGAGINGNSFLKGLLSFAGPMILSGLLSGNRNRGSALSSGNTMLGNNGGLGSLLNMLSGGRSITSAGGLFSRLFGRR
jgi:uncharacterized tellurite resistance protein B-like protein